MESLLEQTPMRTLLAACALLLASSPAYSQVVCTTCPTNAQATAVGTGIAVTRANGTVVQPGQSVGECETLNVLATVGFQGQVLVFVPPTNFNVVPGSGFFAGQGFISVDGSTFDVTPSDMATFRVGPPDCADGLLKGMSNLVYSITPSNAAAGSVTFTFNYINGRALLGDCTLLNAASAQFTALVDRAPQCSVAPAAQEVCAGSNASFTATGTGAGPFTFAWTGPGGFTATGPTISASAQGTYTATVTDAHGCTSTCSGVLTVNPLPECAIIPATQTVCLGDNASFIISATNGTPPYFVTWVGPSGFSGTEMIIIEGVHFSNAGIYTATVVDAKGCSNTCTARLIVEACQPDVEVVKEVACSLGSGTCGAFGKLSTGVSALPDCPAFCYRIAVSNATADVPITALAVSDSLLGNLSARFAGFLPLAPGAVAAIVVTNIEVCVDTRNTVTVEARSAQGRADTDTDFADARVLHISARCSLTLFSSLDQDGNPTNNAVSLPAGSTDVPVAFHATVENTGTSPIRLTSFVTALPHGVTLPVVLAAGATRQIDGEVRVSCPGASFSFQARADADDADGTLCVLNDQGQRAATATDVCAASVSCLAAPAITCRVTGGGVLLPGTVDASCIDVATTIFPAGPFKVTHGGQLGSPFSQMDCPPGPLGNPCIRGQWSHIRHYSGKGNPRDVFDMQFHSNTPKGIYDTLHCACLGCCDPATGAFITPVVLGGLCNPDDHKECGPEPRPAPANAVIFTGVGKLSPATDAGVNGKAAEYVVFRIYIEDRSEPGGFHPGGAVQPADIYCFQAWRTGVLVSRNPNFSSVAPAFRRALQEDSCDFLDDLQSGARPIGSLPDSIVDGDPADVNDCGPLHDGNLQLHPSTSATCD